ncbi:MAG: phosphate signaling complex protein PhoU [Oscillospiraceae bacterium]|nr:phosphate signaling complex protein PhoU [Oscillospiraceae bacterium]
MRLRYEEQLKQLSEEMQQMGALCESVIANAAKAFIDGDLELAVRAIEIDLNIDKMERDIEALCLKLLLQQQPVASDLRRISSALKMITDMERIGDQSSDISEITKLENYHKSEGDDHIADMALAVIKMVTDSIEAYVHEDVEMARGVIDYDDVVDDLFDEIKKDVIEMIRRDNNSGERAVDVLMVAKYFERIGDHATNIAEWVEYAVTGVHR